MKAYFHGTRVSAFSSTVTNYAPIETGAAPTGASNTADINVAQPIPHDLTASNLTVWLQTAPSSGKSWAFTVMKNGSATALTVTISDTDTTLSDTSNSVAFLAGDTISLRSVPSGTPTDSGQVSWSVLQEASGKMAILSGSNGTGFTSAVNPTLYLNPQTNSTNTSTEGNADQPIPVPGTLSNLYVTLDGQPGGTTGWTVNLRKNKSNSGLAVTVSGTNTNGNDTSNSVAVTAGDLIALQTTPASGSPTTRRFNIGYTWTPTTDGHAIQNAPGSATNVSNSATQYAYAVGSNGWNATENLRLNTVNHMTIKGMSVTLSGTPGSGNSYETTIRRNQADTPATVTISGTATTGDVTTDVVVNDGDTLGLQQIPTSTPTARVIKTWFYYVVEEDDPPPDPGFYPNNVETYPNADSADPITYDAGTADDRVLVVAATISFADSNAITGITYDGVAMTLAATQTDPYTYTTATIWYLANPASDANTLAVTSGDNTVVSLAATYIAGANTASIGATGTNAADSSNTNVDITPTEIGSLLLASFVNNTDGAYAPTGGSTEVAEVDAPFSGGQTSALYSKVSDALTSTNIAATGTSDGWAAAAVEILAAGGGNAEVAVDDIAMSINIDTTTIAQVHSIDPADVTMTTALDVTTVANETVTITVQDIALASRLDAGTATQNHVLSPTDIAHTLTQDAISISQNHVVGTQDIALATTEDSTIVDHNHVLSAQSTDVQASLDTATITQNHALSPDDLAFTISTDEDSVSENYTLATQDVALVASADADTINQIHVVGAQDLLLNPRADTTALIQDYVLTAADLGLSASLDGTGFDHTLATADLTLGAVLSGSHVEMEIKFIEGADIGLAPSLGNTTLSQHHVIATQDIRLVPRFDNTQVDDGTFQIRKFYIDSEGNVYWVVDQEIGLVERI